MHGRVRALQRAAQRRRERLQRQQTATYCWKVGLAETRVASASSHHDSPTMCPPHESQRDTSPSSGVTPSWAATSGTRRNASANSASSKQQRNIARPIARRLHELLFSCFAISARSARAAPRAGARAMTDVEAFDEAHIAAALSGQLVRAATISDTVARRLVALAFGFCLELPPACGASQRSVQMWFV